MSARPASPPGVLEAKPPLLSAADAERVARECFAVSGRAETLELGVLIGTDGPDGNVLKIRPPLVFSQADAERLLEALDRALS